MSDSGNNEQKPTRFASSKPDPFSFSSSRHKFAPVSKPKRRRVTEIQAAAIEKKQNDDVHDAALKNRTRKGIILSTSSFLQKDTQSQILPSVAPSELNTAHSLIPESIETETDGNNAPVTLPRNGNQSASIATLTKDLDGIVINEPTSTLAIMSDVNLDSASELAINSHQSQLLLVQMPTSVPYIGPTAAGRAAIKERSKKAAEAKAAEERAKASESFETDNIKTREKDQEILSQSGNLFKQKTVKKVDTTVKLPPSTNILTSLPSGKIGQITVHASGKMYLHINGLKYDVTPGADVNIDQELYSLEPERAAAYHLGQITKRMIISPNTDSLLKGLSQSNRS